VCDAAGVRTFACVCGRVLFFENDRCHGCARKVGWCPMCRAIAPVDPEGDQLRCALRGCGAWLVPCHNDRVERVCNRFVPAQEAPAQPLCDCCRHNAIVPDLSIDGHRERWADLERAKRRLFYQLDMLGLPRGVPGDDSTTVLPLSFDFRADALPEGAPGQWRPMKGEQVLTGHAGGKITINVREADDVARERARVAMDESYRTLLGHFRHEIGHYYWEVLVSPAPDARARFDVLFGDPDAPSYAEALDRHYAQGPPADWATRFTTPYASMHPWEDWAETWAAYLELLGTLDTAVALGRGRGAASPYAERAPMTEWVARYLDLGIDLNELNRAMGLDDLLTRRFSDAVIEKLELVDSVVHASRAG